MIINCIIISISIILTIAVVLVLLYIALDNFYRRIYLPYKKNSIGLDFETAFVILKAIINSELDAYENDIFQKKGSITNSNFDNYYKDITNKIVSSISPDLISHLSLYLTEKTVYVIIARAVKKYLAEKINGTF